MEYATSIGRKRLYVGASLAGHSLEPATSAPNLLEGASWFPGNIRRQAELARGIRGEVSFLEAVVVVVPSLLITDDDSAFRETLCSVFQPRGFRVFSAGDGEEALKILGQEDVHLLLLDMHMPRLTGLETMRRVKLFKSRLPCILLSARLDDALVQQAQLAEAFSVLAKPVSRLSITNAVDHALRRIYGWPEEMRDLQSPDHLQTRIIKGEAASRRFLWKRGGDPFKTKIRGC